MSDTPKQYIATIPAQPGWHAIVAQKDADGKPITVGDKSDGKVAIAFVPVVAMGIPPPSVWGFLSAMGLGGSPQWDPLDADGKPIAFAGLYPPGVTFAEAIYMLEERHNKAVGK